MLRNWNVFGRIPPEQVVRIKCVHVFEGGRSAMFITSGDIVYGLGANGTFNLLGLSGRHRHFTLVMEPLNVERLSLKAVQTISVGDFFGVAHNSNGELYHWGRRMDRRRGILLPHQVKCPYFVISVACGSEFFLILTKEERVFFRGSFQPNDHPILEFTEIDMGAPISSISCGKFHAAMLMADGQVYNCGYDHHATYRTWRPEDGLAPKKLELQEQCSQVVCGRRSTVCLLSSGSVWACGENDNLGVESENSVMKHPAKVKLNEPVRELAATWYSNIYAACSWNGRIYYWGHKTKYPKILSEPCVLLDAFQNKETPARLGMIPVAPELPPSPSFNARSPISRTQSRVYFRQSVPDNVAQRLERSFSAEDLAPPRSLEKTDPKDGNNNEKMTPEATNSNQKSTKPTKVHPPGIGLLVSAGKFLASRPNDRSVHRRAVSPEVHPAKVPKAQFSVASDREKSSKNMTRSHSVETLDSPSCPTPKAKPRGVSVVFGQNNPFSPEYNPCMTEVEQPKTPVYSSSPPYANKNGFPVYPEIPKPVEDLDGNYGKLQHFNRSTSEKPATKLRHAYSNPFLYDPMDAIRFEFPEEAAKLYTEQKRPKETVGAANGESTYNPGTKAMLKYYCLLADIKSEFKELQQIVNELSDVISNL
ncbi:Hypothetical protein NTJ_12699 [Nesidiocoris tenuis]|uniref:Uncharacterized protein n=2 Tax=Nesidiocoris tenuis TaxID=355587 RepID=A0ABN7B645_9HEMI|nr:Hypothetical protein NTJ_12699 [Nesidiocoris tenuis]